MSYCLRCFQDLGKRKGDYCPGCGLELDVNGKRLVLSKVDDTSGESFINIMGSLQRMVESIKEGVRSETFEDVEAGLQTSAEQFDVGFQVFKSSMNYNIEELFASYYLALKDITGEDIGAILMENSDRKPDEVEQVGFNTLNPTQAVKELKNMIFRPSDGTLGEYIKAANKFCIYEAPREVLEKAAPEHMPGEIAAFYNSFEFEQDQEVSEAVLSHEMTHAYLYNRGRKNGFDIRDAPNYELIEEGAAWSITYMWTDQLSPHTGSYPDRLENMIKMFSRYADARADSKKRIDVVRKKAFALLARDLQEDGLDEFKSEFHKG